MSKRMALSVMLTAVTALAWGITPASVGASHDLTEFLTTQGNETVDIWKLVCDGREAKCLSADVCSIGLDAAFVVTIAGYVPGAMPGKGDIALTAS
jgi:hypothetical protein